MVLFRDTRANEVFEELYARSGPALAAWILHLCALRRLRIDPGEILQDTYVNVYRYAGSFRDEGRTTFRTWARAIAANLVRRATARRGLSSLDGEQAFEPADARRGPQETVLAVEQCAELRRAYALLLLYYVQAHAGLSARDRKALELIEVDGMSYAAAGQALRVGRSNMKMIMFRSRRRLRERMQVAMTAGRLGRIELRRSA
jgi:RNA polymerase sigma factor (sigma-70 family)